MPQRNFLPRSQVIWSFGPGLQPVLEVEPGDTVTFETNDCFTGQIRSEDDLVTGIDMTRINGATGPVAVKISAKLGADDTITAMATQSRQRSRGAEMLSDFAIAKELSGLFLRNNVFPVERFAVELDPGRLEEPAHHHVEADQQGEVENLLVG